MNEAVSFLNQNILLILLFFPVWAGIGGLLLIPSRRRDVCKIWGLGIPTIQFLLSLHLPFHFSPEKGFQFVQSYSFFELLPVELSLGVDGTSLWLILLSTFLFPLVALGSWNRIKNHLKGYFICILLIETAVIGVLTSLNLIFFYVFWELVIIPMFLLILLWGSGRKQYSAMKFFLFTALGSFSMLIAIVYLFLHHAPATLTHLQTVSLSSQVQFWCFFGFLLSFAVKIPVFPLHTWLPDAHTDAPTGGSVILAGVLLKLGIYGLIRFSIPLFPEGFEQFQYLLIILGIVGILYGGLMCLLQNDIKRLIAYSSVSHLGFVVFGISAQLPYSEAGAQFLMISHGLTTGGLFFLIGMIYDRTHSRLLKDYSGMYRISPTLSFFFIFLALGSIGVPGLSGFVGEFLVLLGGTGLDSNLYTSTAVLGIILAAWYMLRLVRSIFFGDPSNATHSELEDLSGREISIVLPISLLVLYLGLFPMLLLGGFQ